MSIKCVVCGHEGTQGVPARHDCIESLKARLETGKDVITAASREIEQLKARLATEETLRRHAEHAAAELRRSYELLLEEQTARRIRDFEAAISNPQPIMRMPTDIPPETTLLLIKCVESLIAENTVWRKRYDDAIKHINGTA